MVDGSDLRLREIIEHEDGSRTIAYRSLREDEIPVVLTRDQWKVVLTAASFYDIRLPAEQGDYEIHNALEWAAGDDG